MIAIQSPLEGTEHDFVQIKRVLEKQGFVLGGNWDYGNGSFDLNMDEKNKVWLRMGFEVLRGNVDDQTEDNDASIKLTTPYVLRHLYREGNDPEAKMRTIGALFDQFQAPVDPDAAVDDKWIGFAEEQLRRAEEQLITNH
ncbi:YugN-like family protein [Paenibacillaceae bacterium GAS479]|nr:YugN-like family protein [Paenibacillaceae bacterium GAS479]